MFEFDFPLTIPRQVLYLFERHEFSSDFKINTGNHSDSEWWCSRDANHESNLVDWFFSSSSSFSPSNCYKRLPLLTVCTRCLPTCCVLRHLRHNHHHQNHNHPSLIFAHTHSGCRSTHLLASVSGIHFLFSWKIAWFLKWIFKWISNEITTQQWLR